MCTPGSGVYLGCPGSRLREEQPLIIERTLNEVTWYVVSVRFATQRMAKERWEKIQHEAKKAKGKHDLGFYRHGPSDDPGRFLTAVTYHRPGAVWINNQLRGCEPSGVREDEITAMILRRLDVLSELHATNAPGGSYAIRRPEAGAVLDPDGTIHEPVLGHG